MAGLDITHSRVKNIMQNKRYLGDEYYPQLIDEETFHAAEAERKRREKALGRENRKKERYTPAVFTKFKMLKAEKKYKDPVKQAEYIYSSGSLAEVEIMPIVLIGVYVLEVFTSLVIIIKLLRSPKLYE